MGSNSKVLLELEDNARSSSVWNLGSKLLFTRKASDDVNSDLPDEKPPIFPVPKSQVLGKVKDFLGTISESNKTLLQDAKENPENYDIEMLSGKESHIIEMDLMLGIADLHTPEAVAAAEAAAEAAMVGCQPVISADTSSGSESEYKENDDGNGEDTGENGNSSSRFTSKSISKSDDRKDFSRKSSKNRRSRKRTKIVELC